ncbi:hypothetical protein FBEOM_5813 [Fusarium beomiforme]|uniref:Uncharacterized protein n=1 Tax=Fusarium beomiforme TaxID=44412 RepID=A0A9P5DWT6_9HYPO|nr:hypothetical protein FBEOM_5813 [Fusarium beomiforme]
MSWNRYELGQANIFYDEEIRLFPTEVLPPHVDRVRRSVLDFSCLVNGENDSFHTSFPGSMERLVHSLSPDPVLKTAEKIQNEVVSKVDGGYKEEMWQDIFKKHFFDRLADSIAVCKEDSRRVSRSKYYYDQVTRSTDELWNLFEPDLERTSSSLKPVKCPKPDQAFFLPIYHRHKNIGLPKVIDPKARQWNQHSDCWAMEPFTWTTLQELNKFGLQPTPFRIFEKPPLEANLRCYPWLIVEHKREKHQAEGLERVVNCQAANAAACAVHLIQHTAQHAVKLPRHAHIPPVPVISTVGPCVKVWVMYYAEDFDAPSTRRDTDEVVTKKRKEGYVMRAIWKGDITKITDILAFQMIIDNAHTWATRAFKPLISSYIEQWKHVYSRQGTGEDPNLSQLEQSQVLRQKSMDQRRLVLPMVRDLLDAHVGMELDDMAHKKVTPLFLGMLMHKICSTEREFISTQIEKAVVERLKVIVTNEATVSTQVETLYRVEETAQLPFRTQREAPVPSNSSTQETQQPETDNDDPNDSDYNPSQTQSRALSPSDVRRFDEDVRSDISSSVASSDYTFSKDTTILWTTPRNSETPRIRSSSSQVPERPDMLHRQSSQSSEDSNDATPKPNTAGNAISFNFSSESPGSLRTSSPFGRPEANTFDGPPVFAGRSPDSLSMWPRGRLFSQPKSRKSPQPPEDYQDQDRHSDISRSHSTDPGKKQYIDLTRDSQEDSSNTKE